MWHEHRARDSDQANVGDGGCGFIGANFVRYELETNPAIEITNLDALTYAGNPDNLAGIDRDPRYRFVQGDIADQAAGDQAGGGR